MKLDVRWPVCEDGPCGASSLVEQRVRLVGRLITDIAALVVVLSLVVGE